MARLQTVDKASQSFLPAGKKSVQSFSPAACTSAKIFLTQRVSICALPAHMRHRSERKPSRRQSQKDFVNDLRPSLHGPAFALPGTDVSPWLPSAPTVLFCDAAKASPLALPLGELSAQLTERAVILILSSLRHLAPLPNGELATQPTERFPFRSS